MASFGVKNDLQKDIVTQVIFFNQSEEVLDYLSIKCPDSNYRHLQREDVVKSRIIQNSFKIILDFMKQHLMVFTPNNPVFCKEYLCSGNSCLQFKFKECAEENAPLYSDIPWMMILEVLMMMTTMKLTELDKFLTLFLFRCLLHYLVVPK